MPEHVRDGVYMGGLKSTNIKTFKYDDDLFLGGGGEGGINSDFAQQNTN